MRVLHLCAGNLYGGIERLLVTLARQSGPTPDTDHIFLVCFEGQLSRELREAGVQVVNVGAVKVGRPWTIWRARRRLKKFLKTSAGIDVMIAHACWPHAIFGPTALALGIPLVHWAHDIVDGTHWIDRWASRAKPVAAIAGSEPVCAGVRKLFPGVPVGGPRYPVSPPPPMDRGEVRREVREELKTGLDQVVIVMACRMEAWKGHRNLIAALARMKQMSEWTCWIAGGAQRPEEEAYLADLKMRTASAGLEGRVHFLGQRSDVGRLLAAADIHCQPNEGPEPFGIAFIEAMDAGLPIVTMAMGGPMEMIDESCGILVPPGDVKALTGALSMLVMDESARKRLGAGAPARARSLCDPAMAMGDLQSLLTRVVRGTDKIQWKTFGARLVAEQSDAREVRA